MRPAPFGRAGRQGSGSTLSRRSPSGRVGPNRAAAEMEESKHTLPLCAERCPVTFWGTDIPMKAWESEFMPEIAAQEQKVQS